MRVMEAQMLAGKVAIVTGASYGMGGTIAELFAGASVALTARGREKLDEVVAGIGAKGFKAVGIVADIESAEDTKRAFERTICGGAHTASKGTLNAHRAHLERDNQVRHAQHGSLRPVDFNRIHDVNETRLLVVDLIDNIDEDGAVPAGILIRTRRENITSTLAYHVIGADGPQDRKSTV